MEWSTACLDWRERVVAGKSLLPCGPLYPDEAAAALEIFRALKIVDIADSPSFGDIGRDWVFDLPKAVFGSYNPGTARRDINEFFELISKKNAKSTRAAGIMLTALLLNWRRSAEFFILSPTIEIAKNSAEPAMDMVAEDPELRTLLKIVANERLIEHRETGATLKVIAADSQTVGGKKATGLFVDEYWLFGKRSDARNMLREARGGLASRPEGFVIYASTQSDEQPAGVFKDDLGRFRDIRDGILEAPRSLGLLYEFPEDMVKAGAYRDPKNFYVTNPNLGASVDEQYLLDELVKAKREGPKSEVGFFAKHLNVEVGLASRSDSWAGADHWVDAGLEEVFSLDDLLIRCEVATIGIDGGGLDDLLGATVIGREKGTRRWLWWSHAWAHKSVFERRKDIATALLGFAEDGDLTVVENAGLDVADVADLVEKVWDAGLLPKKNGIGVDPVGIAQIVDEIKARKKIPEDCIVGISQGWKLSGAIKTAERGLADKTIVHCKQPMMAWCAGNAKVEPRGNAITITKQAAGSAKIDPLMAGFNAVALMGLNPEGQNSGYFAERGIRVLKRKH